MRSVPGCIVYRYGTRELIGAARCARKSQRKDGDHWVEWNDRIVMLPAAWCHRYRKELREHLRRGELIKCPKEEWEAQQRSVAAPPIPPAPPSEGEASAEETPE